MDPRGPSQPDISTAYQIEGNPVSQSEHEELEASQDRGASGRVVDQRQQGDISVPSNHEASGVPSSLGYGVQNADGDRGESIGGPVSNTEGEQMSAPGEGDVYRKQLQKEGFGEQPDLASDLDRKKEEQAEAREAIKSKRRDDVDVGGALGDTTGPAAP